MINRETHDLGDRLSLHATRLQIAGDRLELHSRLLHSSLGAIGAIGLEIGETGEFDADELKAMDL